MARFTEYIRRNCRLADIANVVLDELRRNIAHKESLLLELRAAKKIGECAYRNLVRDRHFTEGECMDVVRSMKDEASKCEQLFAMNSLQMQAVVDADATVYGAYSIDSGVKVLDLLAVLSSTSDTPMGWAHGDFKYELKGDGANLFFDEENFRSRVVCKFEDVRGLMNADGEPYWSPRIVVVTTSVMRQALQLFENMKLGTEKPSIIKGDYKIVDSVELIRMLFHARNQYRTYKHGDSTANVFG